MNFRLSEAVDPNKVFLTPKSEIAGRLDPFYYIPSVVALEKKVQKVTPYRLRDFVFRLAGGATPLTSESDAHYTEGDDGIPFIRVQNLSTTGRLNLEDCKRITRNTHETLLERSKLSGGELLVKITGVGRMAVSSVVPESFEGNINQHIVAIRTKDTLTSESIAAYLNLDSTERLASRRATGGTRPALDYPALLSIPIVIDTRIPQKLNAAVALYEEQISKAAKLLSQLDQLLLDELGANPTPKLLNTIENRIFHRPFSQVTGGRLDPLFHRGDIFNFVQGVNCGLVPLCRGLSYFLTGFAAGRNEQSDEDSGVIQIRPTNISDDRDLIFRRNVYIARSEIRRRPLDILKRGEVLFNNTNSQELVGKAAYFNLDGDYFCSNHITRIGTDSEQLDPQYLYYLLNLYQRQKVFFSLCTNWNNQSGIGVDILDKIPIPLPSLKQQEQIVERLDKVRSDAQTLRSKAAEEFSEAKKSIEAMIFRQ